MQELDSVIFFLLTSTIFEQNFSKTVNISFRDIYKATNFPKLYFFSFLEHYAIRLRAPTKFALNVSLVGWDGVQEKVVCKLPKLV